jgi:hypothetical protein
MNIYMLIIFAVGLLQNESARSDTKCPLADFRDGSIVRLTGEVFTGGHDALLLPEGCTERVVLSR